MSAAILVLSAAAASAGSSQYPPRAATCAVAPAAGPAGTSVSLKGTNWQSGSTVTITFEQNGTSSPVSTATVDSKGMYSSSGTIPATAVRGKASVVATGTSIDGSAVQCASNFQVIDPKHAAASLPTPGMPVSAGALLVGVGLLFGATAIRRGRRRSGRTADVKR